MKTLLAFCLLLTLIACEGNSGPLPSTAPKPVAEKTRVIQIFNTYKKAVAEQDGAAAVNCLSSNSITYYDQVLSNILHGDEATIKGLSSGDLMQVLTLRYFFPKEELLEFDGRQLFEAMVDNKFTEDQQLAVTTIGQVAVKGNKAKGQMVLNGKASPIFFDFKKEQNKWRLDLTTTVIMTTKFVETKAQEAGLSVPEFIEAAMQLTEKEKKYIWKPLK